MHKYMYKYKYNSQITSGKKLCQTQHNKLLVIYNFPWTFWCDKHSSCVGNRCLAHPKNNRNAPNRGFNISKLMSCIDTLCLDYQSTCNGCTFLSFAPQHSLNRSLSISYEYDSSWWRILSTIEIQYTKSTYVPS